ncbi:ompa/motb domain protein [Flammeovirgaceae bacterium 311]|nr:ompa/motb domain protein [Flammeovirgaceae bacterium 311]
MSKRFCIVLLLLLVASSVMGQDYKKLMKKGKKHFGRGEINSALRYYLEAEQLESGNVELNLHIGRAYLLSDYKHYALPYLTKVLKLAPAMDPDIRFYMGLACQYNYQFDEAIAHYTAYGQLRLLNKPDVGPKILQCQQGDSLIRYPVAVDIENLGSIINSKEHDYAPIITPDQSVLVFTSRREGSTGGKKTSDGEFFEDIYISYRRGENWTPPRQISKNINYDYHDAAAAISANGKELYLYIEDNGGDLYRSVFNGRDWSEPEPLPEPINTPYWETSLSISPDGKRLFFASDRPGGFGNLDLYLSERLPNGSWGNPLNLGPAINTAGFEDSPYIHPDGKTLYFSSDGHKGLGGYDVFRSERSGDIWLKPVNMGYPINTPDDNFHFIMAENRTHAYYTSIQEGGEGKADIYRITFLDEKVNTILAAAKKKKEEEAAVRASAKPVLPAAANYSGQLLDSESGQPLQGNITIAHPQSGDIITVAQTNEDGSFNFEIEKEGTYALSAEAEGYIILSRTLKVSRLGEKTRYVNTNLRMNAIKVGTTAVMANIFFETGKSSLRTESITELDKIRDFLRHSSSVKIQINGHTDNVGNANYNKQLSRKRAQSVKDYLVNNGIEPGRLSVMGYGQERPLFSNDDEEEGRALNRRTEIEVLSH